MTAVLVNAKDYSLPQHRRRLYLVAIALDHPMLVNPERPITTSSLCQVVEQLKLPMRLLSEFLLHDHDPAVQAELGHALTMKSQEKDKLDKNTKWQDEHAEFFRSHGYRWGAVDPSENLRDSGFFKSLGARKKDVLTILQKIYPLIKRADVSQSISRARPCMNDDFVHTVLPKQQVFDFTRGRWLLGRESLKLQGIDWENVPHVADR